MNSINTFLIIFFISLILISIHSCKKVKGGDPVMKMPTLKTITSLIGVGSQIKDKSQQYQTLYEKCNNTINHMNDIDVDVYIPFTDTKELTIYFSEFSNILYNKW